MSSLSQREGRFMGLDCGTARVGVAVSDGLGITAHPLQVFDRKGGDLMNKLAEVAKEYQVGTIVVGLPTSLGGGEGESAKDARRFAKKVEQALGIKTVFYDERFTSKIAEQVLIEAGASRASRRGVVDKMAAAVMLQGFLDLHNQGKA